MEQRENKKGSENFIELPLTSKIKSRKHSVIIKTEDGGVHRVLLFQVRLFDNRRLWRRKYVLDIDQYKSIKSLFSDLYKIQ